MNAGPDGARPATLVHLAGIVAAGRHGANPGEQDARQEFVVDVDVWLAAEGDALEDTADYRDIVATVRAVVAERSFHLLETLAQDVARSVQGLDRVVRAAVVVHKPSAAASLGVADVSAGATEGS